MALQTAVNPETNQTAVLVDGQWQTVEQVATNPKDSSKAYLVGGKWLTDTGTTDLPKPAPTGLAKAAGAVGSHFAKGAKVGTGILEEGAQLISGAGASIVGGLAGIGQGVLNSADRALGGQGGKSAADRVQQVQSALTYQPRTNAGQAISQGAGTALSYVSTKPGEWVGEHGRAISQKMGASPELSAAIGAAGNTAVQTVPQILLGKGAGLAVKTLRGAGEATEAASETSKPGGATKAPPGETKPPPSATSGAPSETAEARAKAYVANLGLDWGRVSDRFKATLTGIAQDANGLGRLKPEQVRRQALLAQVGIDTPSKGQITRDPTQRGLEASVKATEAGKPLLEQDYEHNKILQDNVENLRKRVTQESVRGPEKVARGDLPVGRAVQDSALRAKAKASKARVDNLYKLARKTEPDAAVPVDSLYELLGKNPHIQHLGWVGSWLKRAKIEAGEVPEGAPEGTAPPRRPVTLNELNDLRAEANGIIKGGGTDAHYAAQVKQAIDEAMEGVPAGAKAWKEAIGAYKKHAEEFKDQGAVRGLVEDKPYSSDRRIAIEETAKKTVTGKLEDLQKVKRSLLTGGDATSRAAGKAAWRDLKGWGIDYIRERMTRGPKNELGDPHTTWVGLKRALDDIGDENLDELYGPSVRKQLRKYEEAAEILWTDPSIRTTGSPTLEKVLRFLDRVGNVPGLGKASELAGGTVKGIAKVAELGRGGREVREAQTTPLDEQLSAARRDIRRGQTYQARKKVAKKAAPLAPAAEQRQEP